MTGAEQVGRVKSSADCGSHKAPGATSDKGPDQEGVEVQKLWSVCLSDSKEVSTRRQRHCRQRVAAAVVARSVARVVAGKLFLQERQMELLMRGCMFSKEPTLKSDDR